MVRKEDSVEAIRNKLTLSAVLILVTMVPEAASAQASGTARVPVLVELFTSEGCSSCPPADKLLAVLQREQPVASADIIALEEHVDYWEKDGWHDRFSSSQYTDRQNQYIPRLKFNDVYTPQMVVDGSVQFVGNDPRKALDSISHAAETPKIPLTLSGPVVDGKHILCSVSAGSGPLQLPKGDLYAVVVQPSASTEVKAGENGGRHLEHVNVVRSMQRIGKVQDLASGPVKFSLGVPSNTTPTDLRLVVFAQGPGQGVIAGAASASLQH
jgi:hypothetical protein